MSFAALSHPEAAQEMADELVGIARSISAYQDRTAPRLSNEQMLRTYPGLGSTKTYRALTSGNVDGLIAANHLPKYRAVWDQIQATTGADGREELYNDLTPAFECSMAAAGLIPQRGKARLVLIEGPTGSGKSSSLSIIASKYAGQVVIVEATDAWQSPMAMFRDFLVALGCFSAAQVEEGKIPNQKAECQRLVLAALKSKRIVVAIDEAQHGGAPMLNFIKTAINQTDSLFIVATIDTLWGKLARQFWEEAKQLVYNRLFERVRLAPPSPEDVETFLTRRVPRLEAMEWRNASAKVAEIARAFGGFAFLRHLAEQLAAVTAEITPTLIADKAEDLKKSLQTR